ncbi:SMUG2 DNA glycosylase family protein [Vitellibacter sp. q18]|nr:SMUG2 DNA glycosylase family protein [Aequorivita lutea]
MTFADKIIKFNTSLSFNGSLPSGIEIMNPFAENPEALKLSSKFYKKFYSDNKKRNIIFGINPGRHGAGVTGVPFTDTKRLEEFCSIQMQNISTHEPSSVFVYDMITAYGGVERFYEDFYINSVCPLGFVENVKGKYKNYNYFDSKELSESIKPFIIESIKKQISFGINTDVCYCLGTTHNFKFLLELNNEEGFFKKIVALEHPRFIQQYKSKNKHRYIDKYIQSFKI